MKKITKILLVAIALVAFASTFTACKKYEDGPAFSLRSKTARVANVWKLDKAFLNGEEFPLTEEQKDIFEYTKDGKIMVDGKETGTWAFDGDKENIIETTVDPESNETSKDTAKILRLKNSELWLEAKNGETTMEAHYVTK